MVSISGSKKLKRQMAPQFWGIGRKDKRFVITVRPGPHKKEYSVPTAIFLRDVLKIVTTLREAKAAIYTGKVKIDGVVRKSLHHAIGLMDVIKLEKDSQVLVTRGINAGQIGKIESIEEGTFILPRRAVLILGERKIEIPTHIIMAIG